MEGFPKRRRRLAALDTCRYLPPMNPVTPQSDANLAFQLERINREAATMTREQLLEALKLVSQIAQHERTKANFFRQTWEPRAR